MKKKIKHTKEEKEILEAFEKGRLHRIKGFENEKKFLQETARLTLNKDKRINIRRFGVFRYFSLEQTI